MQKAQVLRLLEHGPKTTFELRNHGITHPAGRIKSLRADGFKIDTVFCKTEADHRGFSHLGVAKYVLQEAAR